jgi:hypothetical protein
MLFIIFFYKIFVVFSVQTYKFKLRHHYYLICRDTDEKIVGTTGQDNACVTNTFKTEEEILQKKKTEEEGKQEQKRIRACILAFETFNKGDDGLTWRKTTRAVAESEGVRERSH